MDNFLFYHDDNPKKHASVQHNLESNNIRFNSNSDLFEENNYYDLLLTFKHEKQHLETPEDSGTGYSEYKAYASNKFDPNFNKTSDYFQKLINEGYDKYSKYKPLDSYSHRQITIKSY